MAKRRIGASDASAKRAKEDPVFAQPRFRATSLGAARTMTGWGRCDHEARAKSSAVRKECLDCLDCDLAARKPRPVRMIVGYQIARRIGDAIVEDAPRAGGTGAGNEISCRRPTHAGPFTGGSRRTVGLFESNPSMFRNADHDPLVLPAHP